MSNLILENCQLEWDRGQGRLYIHNKDTGGTVLRVYGLTPVRDTVKLDAGQMIDLNVGGEDHRNFATVPTA